MEVCIHQFMEGFMNQVQQFEFYEKLLEMSKQKAHDLFSIFNHCDCYRAGVEVEHIWKFELLQEDV